jgi:hypothetical protein
LANTIDQGGDGPKTIRWAFDGEALAWGNQVLGNIHPCDLLVIDELGPLEFERGEGWMHGFTAVDDGDYTLAVVVIRPDLVDKALEKWPCANILEIDKPENVAAQAEAFFRTYRSLSFNGKEPPDGGSRRDAVATLSYGYEEGCHSVGIYTAIFHWQHLLFRGIARCEQGNVHPVGV